MLAESDPTGVCGVLEDDHHLILGLYVGWVLCEPPARVRQHGGEKHASACRRQFPNPPNFYH